MGNAFCALETNVRFAVQVNFWVAPLYTVQPANLTFGNNQKD